MDLRDVISQRKAIEVLMRILLLASLMHGLDLQGNQSTIYLFIYLFIFINLFLNLLISFFLCLFILFTYCIICFNMHFVSKSFFFFFCLYSKLFHFLNLL